MKTYHLVTAVIGTIITALAVWSLLIWGSMWLGMKAYERGDYAAAQDYYATAERISPIDQWRPDFGQGTALLAQDQVDAGIAKLEEALETVPEAEVFEGGVKDPNSYECLVRANLYLGYAAADRDDEAEAIIETCPNPNPNATGGGGDGDEDDESVGDQDENDGDGDQDGDQDSEQDNQDPQERELQERNREANEQRQREQEYGNGGGGRQENW